MIRENVIKFAQNCIAPPSYFFRLVPFMAVKTKKRLFLPFYTVHIECVAGRCLSLPMSDLYGKNVYKLKIR